jgi:hypothetical protein
MITLSASIIATAAAPPQPTPADLSSIASTFASFAEIMTGFSFAALTIYLAYEYSTGAHARDESRNQDSGNVTPCTGKCEHRRLWSRQVKCEKLVDLTEKHPVNRNEIGATLFYAIASLAISSFLYASLTGQVEKPAEFADELLVYGIVFGTSVLSLFYAVTLMTYTNSSTRNAAKAAFVVVVLVGPAIVFRFLVVAAQNAWEAQYGPSGGLQGWTAPEKIGDALLIILLVAPWFIYSRKKLKDGRFCKRLCVYVVHPAGAVFAVAALVTAISVVTVEPVALIPPRLLITLSLVIGFAVLGLFAIACGCVVGPRLSLLKAAEGRAVGVTAQAANGQLKTGQQ